MAFSCFGFLRFLFCCDVEDDLCYSSTYRRANNNHFQGCYSDNSYVRINSSSSNYTHQENKSKFPTPVQTYSINQTSTSLQPATVSSKQSQSSPSSFKSSNFRTSVPKYYDHYPNLHTQTTLKKESEPKPSTPSHNSIPPSFKLSQTSISTPSISTLKIPITLSIPPQVSFPSFANPLHTSSAKTSTPSDNSLSKSSKPTTSSFVVPQSSSTVEQTRSVCKISQSSSVNGSSYSSPKPPQTSSINQTSTSLQPAILSSKQSQSSPSSFKSSTSSNEASKGSTKPSQLHSTSIPLGSNTSSQKLFSTFNSSLYGVNTNDSDHQGKANYSLVEKDHSPRRGGPTVLGCVKIKKDTKGDVLDETPSFGFIESLARPSASSCKVSQPPSSAKISLPYLDETSSPSKQNPSPRKLPATFKSTLSKVTKKGSNLHEKEKYVWVEKDSSPLYLIPEDIRCLIEKDIVPEVLNKPLSPSTYKDYFAALLYAEEYDYEKWKDYELRNMTVELHEAAIYDRPKRYRNFKETEKKDEKIFVVFRIDSIPEDRPYLLSRDLVHARPSGSDVEPFQGILYRVVKSNLLLVEFEGDFHSEHYPDRRYDISFSFNRVCLKRAHQAINAISDSFFQDFLFPECISRRKALVSKTDSEYLSPTVHEILSIQGSPPYILNGPRCVDERKSSSNLRKPSRTGRLSQEAVIQIHKKFPHCRILICAPYNSACDVLMRGLQKVIPESDMFRANAAFREIIYVPDDILPSCIYNEERFSCPSLEKLGEFRVIFATFVSSFRLHSEGLPVGHFSHIFMVDTSFGIEPDAMVPLANFADKNTTVIVSGQTNGFPRWIRSGMARKYGLQVSYFERLRQCWPYASLSQTFITELDSYNDPTTY